MGGAGEVQKFFRMYMIPGMAHSSQGRPYAAAGNGNGNAVPVPKLPGNANQNPTREQDTMFSALADWVERGVAPGDIVLTSRDNSVSYPICVYPKKITWGDGATGSAKEEVAAHSYSCTLARRPRTYTRTRFHQRPQARQVRLRPQARGLHLFRRASSSLYTLTIAGS